MSSASPRSDSRGPDRERTERGLIGFYASCTVFGVAVSVAAVIWIVFADIATLAPLAWVAAVVAAIAAFATWHYLGVMRAER
ncbi:MAG: hypothetical protein HZB39_14040 [Planctomycetes bacterium]|nr:hypothetical protein [Planctomycetota bacterium]